jgi:hypothetical protein
MLQITSFTSDYKQTGNIALENGKTFSYFLQYIEMENAWYYDINYDNGAFVAKGRRLVCDFNILRMYKNIIPFGIMCISDDAGDPCLLDDLENGRVRLFVLNNTDIAELESTLYA